MNESDDRNVVGVWETIHFAKQNILSEVTEIRAVGGETNVM